MSKKFSKNSKKLDKKVFKYLMPQIPQGFKALRHKEMSKGIGGKGSAVVNHRNRPKNSLMM
jgi:hypothetical protein